MTIYRYDEFMVINLEFDLLIGVNDVAYGISYLHIYISTLITKLVICYSC